MKHTVYFQNRQKAVSITPAVRALIRKAVSETLRGEAFPRPAEVSVSFVDNEEIHALNLEYRGKDKPTDVLSFPMWEKKELDTGTAAGDIDPENDAVLLGDIVISAEKAVEQAAEYGHSPEREFAFLSVHSTLHLLGYDHVDEDEALEMEALEKEILDAYGLTGIR